MKKTSSLKSTVIVIVIIAVALLAYFYYKGSSPSDSSAGLSQGSPSTDTDLIGSQVLGLLSQIQSLRIDTTLFTDPGYQTLRDYAVQIPAENVGRTNPFAPLPGAPAPQTSGSTSH